MENRTRNIQLILRVTPKEQSLIREKMALLGTDNFNAYARKMLIDGYAINVDLADYRTLANEVNKIGVNINQIAKIANETRCINPAQFDQLQKEVSEIWLLLKSSLSTLLSASR